MQVFFTAPVCGCKKRLNNDRLVLQKFEDRFQGRKKFDSESAPSDNESGEVRGESEFAG